MADEFHISQNIEFGTGVSTYSVTPMPPIPKAVGRYTIHEHVAYVYLDTVSSGSHAV